MGIRPAVSYRKVDGPAYTRVARRVMNKAFIRGVPGSKTHTFNTGKPGSYKYEVTLVSKEAMQIRHNQLEAARVAANQYVQKLLGAEGYFMKVFIVPYHVLRENALATGAGADRFQSGMARNFGKPIGVAARVRRGTRMMAIWVPEGKLDVAKEAFRRATIKLSNHTRLDVKEDAKTH